MPAYLYRSARILAVTLTLVAVHHAASGAPPASPQPIVIERTPALGSSYLRVHGQLLRDGEPLEGKASTANVYQRLGQIEDASQISDVLNKAEKTTSFGAFLDTGASGHVLSSTVVDQFGVEAEPNAIYHETGLHGEVVMGVSAPYTIALEGAQGLHDTPDGSFTTVQQDARLLLKRDGGGNQLVEMALGGINVVGMPVIRRRMVQIDLPTPGRDQDERDREQAEGGVDRDRLNDRLAGIDMDQLNQLLERSGALGGPAVSLHSPDHRPASIDHIIPLTYVNYARRRNPKDRGPLPSLAANPTIEGVTTSHDGQSHTTRWFVDTGAPVSMISTSHAQALGLLDSSGNPNQPPDFRLPLGGVSGRRTMVPGYRVNELSLRTKSGRMMVYKDVPLLVHDITTTLDNGQRVTLDGLFGLNLMLPGGSGRTGLAAQLLGASSSDAQQPAKREPKFEAVWIDGPRGRLLLDQRDTP